MNGLHFCLGTIATVLTAGPGLALDCRLAESGKSAVELVISVICGDGHPSEVRYPDGTLYLGVSLYEPFALDLSLRNAVLPGTDYGDALDLPAQPFEAEAGTRDFHFPIGASAGQTHYLAAVWDVRNECGTDAYGRCAEMGFTLGRTDGDGLPYPIDAQPRPFCDLETLKDVAYFDMVRSGEIDIGFQGGFDEEIMDYFLANDCWRYSPELPGLGYSVKEWRLAPLYVE